MGLITLLFSDPVLFIISAVLLLYSVITHEVAHGWVAYLFGDNTAKFYGRLTFNPVSHLDLLGTLMLFLVGFGWAKPVPIDYDRLNHSRLGLVCVSLAGCAANILIAAVSLLLLHFGPLNANQGLATALAIVIRINIILGAFNLIPIPPLDGSRIVMAFLPEEAQRGFARLEPYGFFILIILLFTGFLDPVIIFMQNAIYGLIGMLFHLFGAA